MKEKEPQKTKEMKLEDLIKLYEEKKEKYGNKTYKHISELLREAKKLHKKDWSTKPTPNKDHEQSWRAFKGKNFEKLIMYIIKDEVEKLGLKVVDGNTLEKSGKNLPKELSQVKRNLLIDYGEFGALVNRCVNFLVKRSALFLFPSFFPRSQKWTHFLKIPLLMLLLN